VRGTAAAPIEAAEKINALLDVCMAGSCVADAAIAHWFAVRDAAAAYVNDIARSP
jgi:hypothetical protein